MFRVIALIVLLLLPAGASAQRIHEARTAMARPAFSVAEPAPEFSSAEMSRSAKIGYWALGGAIVGGAVGAVLGIQEAKKCEDFCVAPIATVYMITGLSALAGGLLGALVGVIVTSVG